MVTTVFPLIRKPTVLTCTAQGLHVTAEQAPEAKSSEDLANICSLSHIQVLVDISKF